MKRFLMWAGAKIGRFFCSWRFPAFVFAIVLLIVLFYAEEDWRGAHRWAANKAKWEAKGETFDFAKFVPPPVPDDRNLGALPLFKLELASKTDSYLRPLVLEKAMRQDLPGGNLPPPSYRKPGDLPDMAKIREAVAQNYAAAFPGVKPPADALDQFAALYPFLKDFLAASDARPLCRLPGDYTTSPPVARSLGVVVAGIKLSRILTVHAILALNDHHPELALEDIKANYVLLGGMKRDPTLVGGLVAIGMMVISQSALADGLDKHAWSDAQLTELDRMLKPINFLADYQFALRCEVAESTANLDNFQKKGPSQIFLRMEDSDLTPLVRFAPPWPRGWWDDNKSQTTDFYFREMSTVDPRALRAFPEIDRALKEEFARAQSRWDANAPWNIFYTIATSPMSDLTVKYALAQARIDEARIAIALERYRLAHGAYPGSLDALAPAFIGEVPRDVMNGEAYRYGQLPDGTFLLYSVGWDQRDDRGKVVRDAKGSIDFDRGDWVWPCTR